MNTLDSNAAQLVLQKVRALDPALATYIDAVVACDVCMNPLHDWTNRPHGDLCQRLPVVSADQYAELAESLAAERHQLQLTEASIANLIGDLTEDDADALFDWIVEQDPSDDTAAASMARQTAFGERLCAFYLQQP
jgi:hypothetical protein